MTQKLGADYLWGLKGDQSGILERAQRRLPQDCFPSEYDSGWNKQHGRLVPWRLQRVGLSPEAAGLCACGQFLAGWREQKKLRQGQVLKEFEECSFCATRVAPQPHPTARLLQFVRDHWSASENGAHHRRDVSLCQDASQISGRTRALVMATLRDLVLGLFELQKHRGKTQARTLPSWRRKLTHPQKMARITRTLA